MSPGTFILWSKVKVISTKTVPEWIFALLWVLASSSYHKVPLIFIIITVFNIK